jgi:hypothetical protein
MEHARLTANVDRVIHVPLTEAEWKAFLAATPQPVDWLRARIQEIISKEREDKSGDA